MGVGNHYEEIDEFAIRVIKNKAKQLVGKVGFTQSDLGDLEQNLVLDLLRRIPKYNPLRAHWRTFIVRVLDHQVATMIKAQEAGIRDYRRRTCSLNDLVEDEDGHVVERGETIDQEDYLRRTGREPRPATELTDLILDVRSVMANLPRGLHELCQLLQTESVTEVSRNKGIARKTIYKSLKKLRTLLEDTELKDYL